MSAMPKEPQAYGTWHVTTEGDCEGRTTRNLGVHTGYIDEIAFALADRAYYGLQFKPVELDELKSKPKTGTKVQVSLSIESGTWDLGAMDRVKYFKQLLAGRNVHVGKSHYFASVELCDGETPDQRELARRLMLAERAKAKLSAEELAALVTSLGE